VVGKHWFPDPIWEDESCYIIGGGPSLKGFDWNLLKDKNRIGCNAAFYLGADIVPIMIFGDAQFLKQHRSGLDSYAKAGGWVVTNSTRIEKLDPPKYLKQMKKQLKGCGINCLAWNGNTGASAINLALLFGVNIIYLLGFDMQLGKNGKANFHDAYNQKTEAKTYNRFIRGMVNLSKDVRRFFPKVKIINLEDDTSALGVFPKESLKEHFSERKVS